MRPYDVMEYSPCYELDYSSDGKWQLLYQSMLRVIASGRLDSLFMQLERKGHLIVGNCDGDSGYRSLC